MSKNNVSDFKKYVTSSPIPEGKILDKVTYPKDQFLKGFAFEWIIPCEESKKAKKAKKAA